MYDIGLFSILACILSLCGYIPYIQNILKRKTKPSRTSWLIWTLLGAVLTYNAYLAGVGNAIFLMILGFLGTFFITILSFIYSNERSFVFSNYVYLAFVAAAALSLLYIDSRFVSICVCISINFIGMIPTLRNAYFNPLVEHKQSWLLFFLANVLNTIEIQNWPLEIFIYQSYILVSGFLVVFLLFRSITFNLSASSSQYYHYFLNKLKKRI